MPTTLYQIPVFVAMLYGGFAIGIVYDLLRVIRAVFRVKRLGNAILDGVFWLIAALICFALLYWLNGAELRLFSLLGLCAGAVIYLWGISRLAQSFFADIARKMAKRRKRREKRQS